MVDKNKTIKDLYSLSIEELENMYFKLDDKIEKAIVKGVYLEKTKSKYPSLFPSIGCKLIAPV